MSYALTVTSTTPGADGVKTWTSADNEELGGYQIKRSNGFDVVTGTITGGLDPSTPYTAVLRLTDVNGNTYATRPVSAVTDVARTRHLVVFDRALAAGVQTLPQAPVLAVDGDGGVDGGPSLHYRLPAGTAFENLRVDGLGLTIDSSLTHKLFASAYLEFWIRGIGTPESSWSDVWIRTTEADGGTCGGDSCIYEYPAEWLYHPDPAPGTYRRVQVPLSRFSLLDSTGTPYDAGALTLDTLLVKAIYEVNVGCPYASGDQGTYLDQIAIWW